jgi:hypothetical protein
MFALACSFFNHAKYVLLLVTLTQSTTVNCALRKWHKEHEKEKKLCICNRIRKDQRRLLSSCVENDFTLSPIHNFSQIKCKVKSNRNRILLCERVAKFIILSGF